ncbi:Thermospermine synthase ACAULIS5 [Capsicum baccatum]|uniref:Thermospermine synthase ACAULIS5 n=1 Tax=Capsicum baccatum TaxID=33114 RepID=A0A2G2XBE5_CAPBA|nr:Thermospermine synthase ACAULIS5 [Capsicum baccatum]
MTRKAPKQTGAHQKQLDILAPTCAVYELRAELEQRQEKFDIIVGDLADPVEGGPCYQLYTQSFYENIVKPKLDDTGIFVTQAGPAGVFTHKEVFSSIYNTIKQVFKYVLAYTAHVPSFADTWGWVMASDQPFCLDAGKMDKKIAERIEGELLYLNGALFFSSTILNKTITKTLKNESHVYTEDDASPKNVFIMGGGEESAVTKVLRHKSREKIVMRDIDQEVVDLCKKHLIANHEAFRNKKLNLVINDAKAELEQRQEKFDIIVGDLVDPVEGGPCYQLYTQSFYEISLNLSLMTLGQSIEDCHALKREIEKMIQDKSNMVQI